MDPDQEPIESREEDDSGVLSEFALEEVFPGIVFVVLAVLAIVALFF